jgi:hypothetical protein
VSSQSKERSQIVSFGKLLLGLKTKMERKAYFKAIKEELINSPIGRLSIFFTILSIVLSVQVYQAKVRQASMPIVEKPSLTLEQKIGKANEKIQIGNSEKQNPEFVKDFAVNTLTKLLTWRLYLFPVSVEDAGLPRIDPGVAIQVDGKTSVRIPTSVWEDTSTRFDDLGGKFLSKELAPLISSLKITQGSSSTLFIPVNVQDPIEVKANRSGERLWKIKVKANIVVKRTPNSEEELIPFTKDVYIKYVVSPVEATEGLERVGSLKITEFRNSTS